MKNVTIKEIHRLLDWLKKHPDPSVCVCSEQIRECVEIILEKDNGND